jgi:hypothetical protein
MGHDASINDEIVCEIKPWLSLCGLRNGVSGNGAACWLGPPMVKLRLALVVCVSDEAHCRKEYSVSFERSSWLPS